MLRQVLCTLLLCCSCSRMADELEARRNTKRCEGVAVGITVDALVAKMGQPASVDTFFVKGRQHIVLSYTAPTGTSAPNTFTIDTSGVVVRKNCGH